MEYKIENCSEKEKSFIVDRLVRFNLEQMEATQEPLFLDLSKKIVYNGEIAAGVIARMYCWNCVYIDTVWVDERFRGKGIGRELLEVVTKEAKERGAYLAHLDTFDFQARGFYEKMGYEVFGELKDCPRGHVRFFMKKLL